MSNPIIETDLAEILKDIRSDQKLMLKEIENLKIGQVSLEGNLAGKIETLNGKFEQIDKRVGNIEFANRGIFVGMILAVIGGAVKLLGILP
jgi:hypothetical protein